MSEGNKPEDLPSLHRRLDELRARRGPAGGGDLRRVLADAAAGCWRGDTGLAAPDQGERRWQVAACTAVAIGLQAAVPGRLGVLRPVWILPALQASCSWRPVLPCGGFTSDATFRPTRSLASAYRIARTSTLCVLTIVLVDRVGPACSACA